MNKLFKKCSVKECENTSKSKGFCLSHYVQFKRQGCLTHLPLCKAMGCKKHTYAKGFCSNHYSNYKRCGTPYGKMSFYNKCKIQICNRRTKDEYCSKHKSRILNLIKHNLPLDGSIHANTGERNVNWKGGIFLYPNHGLMKRNRKIKILQTKGRCEDCGKKWKQIHHLDESKHNHNIENLRFLCCKCHGKYRLGNKNKKSKFIRMYGNTIVELSKKLNASPGYILKWHKSGILKNKINQFNP